LALATVSSAARRASCQRIRHGLLDAALLIEATSCAGVDSLRYRPDGRQGRNRVGFVGILRREHVGIALAAPWQRLVGA
jgi:hypothetical protein